MDGPDQNYHLDKIKQEFAWVTNGAVRGCVGAIDGVAIRIRRPLSSDSGLFGRVDNPALYFNRKGFYSVNMQAVVVLSGYTDPGIFPCRKITASLHKLHSKQQIYPLKESVKESTVIKQGTTVNLKKGKSNSNYSTEAGANNN